MPFGCMVAMAGFMALCGLWYAFFPGPIPAVLGVMVLALMLLSLLHFVRGRFLLARVQAQWAPRGIRCLLVSSDSDHWKEHIETRWVPRIGAHAARLNWSRRREVNRSLEYAVFAHFTAGWQNQGLNFNPAVIVFRGLRWPLVFRFFYAFREARAGRPQYLEEQEAQMFAALGA